MGSSEKRGTLIDNHSTGDTSVVEPESDLKRSEVQSDMNADFTTAHKRCEQRLTGLKLLDSMEEMAIKIKAH